MEISLSGTSLWWYSLRYCQARNLQIKPQMTADHDIITSRLALLPSRYLIEAQCQSRHTGNAFAGFLKSVAHDAFASGRSRHPILSSCVFSGLVRTSCAAEKDKNGTRTLNSIEQRCLPVRKCFGHKAEKMGAGQ